MTDYASFKYGAVQYPLPASGSGIGGAGASLLRDADPALFYLLEFYKSVLQTHLGTRLLAEATAAGASHITATVAETLPLNPESFLTEEHIKFPLLAAYRKSSKLENIGGHKHAVDDVEVVYVLPPLQAGEAERLVPILKAAYAVLDNRTEQGNDPAYTPTTPTGTAGEHVWQRAGVASAEVKGASFGTFPATENLVFPAVILSVELKEKSDVAVAEFENWSAFDANIDIEDPVQETTVSNVVQISVYPPPTVTLASPNSGTKAGGTAVTLTGTNFRVGTTPTVTFGGVAATSVVVVNATTITCQTPAHDAFTTFIADVVVTNIDGQSGTLVAGYTFTTP